MCECFRTSGTKAGKKFKVVFVPVKTIHCETRFTVSDISITKAQMCGCAWVCGCVGSGVCLGESELVWVLFILEGVSLWVGEGGCYVYGRV